MSEQKLISPLLDGFVMGDAMSSHDGIHCCPAIRENSEEKYIVKIISVPASQKQLDALLFTGAYPDAASATDYFKEVADGIVKEAELLKQLSKLEGFLAYDNWQIVPMEGSKLGYQVYLTSPYKRSLEKHLRRSTMTHLGVVNLGLDLCAALSICRRSGYMHADLKPSNIFLTGKNEYRIGDLGFVKLNSLKYTSLPKKYYSQYTPPELQDAMNTLNPTADIYAVGMILYQIYNNGTLPFDEKAPSEPLPAPANADYELAEIILKACDPNPRNRWQTPIEMGQALVSYMKRNNIHDTPIVPPAAEAEYLDAAYEPAVEQPMSNADETVPNAQDAEELGDVNLTEDACAMLAQAEELIAEPQAVETAPEEDPLPAPEQAASVAVAEPEVPEDEGVCDDDEEDDEEEEVIKPAVRKKPRKKGGFLKILIVIVLLGALAFGGYYYYQNIYLLQIHGMEVVPFENTVTVNVDTDAEEELLNVVCTDSYGNRFTQKLSGGKAVFTELSPGTVYTVELAVEGFHDLSGYKPGTVATQKENRITEFSYINGTEDGSLVLTFAAEGSAEDWILEYTAEDEEVQSMSFTGNTVTVSGLTVGKTYAFTLVTVPGADHYITGNCTLDIPVTANVLAENLAITSCQNGELTTQWAVPADTNVVSWNVRCYNDSGYDEVVTVIEPTAVFTGIAPETAYTVEVTAAGMTVNARAYITANPATITDIAVDDTTDGKLTVTWNSGDVMPEGGWLLLYTMGTGTDTSVISCTENKAVIEPAVPGAAYHLTIQPADGSTVFGGKHTCEVASAAVFNANAINSAEVTASLCPTPGKSNWTYKDIADTDYTATHGIGSKVSMVLYSPTKADRANENISVMFVIRDSEGNPLPSMTNVVTATWNDLWNNRSRYCSLDIPAIPDKAGEYTVEVYFNRQFVIAKTLTVID